MKKLVSHDGGEVPEGGQSRGWRRHARVWGGGSVKGKKLWQEGRLSKKQGGWWEGRHSTKAAETACTRGRLGGKADVLGKKIINRKREEEGKQYVMLNKMRLKRQKK